MKHYAVPDVTPARRLPFYLAMEEWAAMRCGRDEEVLFTWQVEPTVIIGRNQELDKEVDRAYCREHGIEVYRRKSGGGCVFADMSNIMFSYITRSPEDMPTIFTRYTAIVAGMLRELGIPAEVSGRNDITIGGRKVSGNAFYRTADGAYISHGTMLYDTDMSHMVRAITPSRAKLESKQVTSVESRVTMLREHTAMSQADFRHRAIALLTDDEYRLTDADIAEVERLAEPYYEASHIEGRRRHTSHRFTGRIEGVGEVTMGIDLDRDGRIADLQLTGDFFATADGAARLADSLRGVPFTRDDVACALNACDSIITGTENNRLVNIIF